jgi:hypothetical protein
MHIHLTNRNVYEEAHRRRAKLARMLGGRCSGTLIAPKRRIVSVLEGSIKSIFVPLRDIDADTFRKNDRSQSLIRMSSRKPILLLGVVIRVQVPELVPAGGWMD